MWILLAVGAAFVIAAMYMPHLAREQAQAFQSGRAVLAAQEAENIGTAALHYVTTYQTQLEGAASATVPAIVTVPALISTGFLHSGTQPVNPWGQTWQVEVLQPQPGTLEALLVTVGGNALPDIIGSQITAATVNAQNSSVQGGWLPQNNAHIYPSNTIVGAGGEFKIPVGNWNVSAGHLADYVDVNGGAGVSWNVLYRNSVPGEPELNTMNTPLIMAAIENSGAGCNEIGAIAQDGTGALLSCQSGAWTPVGGGQWKPPVSTFNALPGTGNQNGDVRLVENIDRAFAWNGSTWKALGIDQNGNLTIPNQLTAQNGQITSWMGCDGHAGMSIGEINAISEPTCGSGAVGFDLGNTSTGVDTAVFNQNGLQVWNGRYGTMFHVGYHGTANGPNYVLYGQQNGYGNWGFNNNANNGWGMVDTDGGGMNATPGDFHASINANDYYDRASGEWFSQVASQVNNQQNQINNLNNYYNQLNNDYSYQQTEITNLQNQLHGQYIGSFGPATDTSSSSCGWYYTSYGYQYRCTTTYGPPSVSGAAPGTLNVDNNQGAGSGMGLPSARLMILVTALVGSSSNGSSQGANWGGLNNTCTGNGVGASMLAYVNGQQVADVSLSKSGQPDYQTWVTTENSTSFIVPAGSSFSIQANNTCVQFKGTIWEF